ncbi:MAG: hypothetical protein IK102_01710 [Treponema sp.]|nr:hypothetical protein [Treponema sp.]
MKKISSFIADLLWSIGLALIVFIIITGVLIEQFKYNMLLDSFALISAVAGLAVTILGIGYSRKLHQIFIGMELLFWGIFTFLVLENHIPYKFTQWWPMIGIMSGIFLFIAGMIRFKSLKVGYFFPAIALFVLGGWYMLFSMYIIEIPFRVVAIVGGPLFFILSGLFIIGFFLLQRKYKNLIAKENESENADFGSELPVEQESEEKN